ncbi:flagellar brake protein [Roseateles saccharophilus]|uniref:C-di-GMP-binding flagellar brake protein YcgR n=1 Tax=Roseateles saccharophilus TaxID=304 RepID=A0A4R3V240_ROSSA|nr:flagellar brake protein [Roseateles saccharophilus]MDG0834624.1 flagellar brake protein [Roseateles saccharophilus]TCU98856.1 c-di-GMP-binding flagellar brake protein YcgR [Roseateles saccharophilus]
MSATTQAAPEELRVSTITEITAYLQQLQREDAALMLSGPPGLSLPSRIVALDPAADLLGLEIGADPEGISQALVAGGEITAVAYLGTIKLQFELEASVLVSGAQGAVLRGTLPTRLYRFQRRQSYRVQPAGSLYPRVVVPGGAQPGHALRVLDISIGGLALALPADVDPAPLLPIGHVAAGLVLELDRITALRVALLPHHASPIGGDPGGTRQLGCAFVDLDAAAGRSLQVYVDQTQKRRRLLKLDL